MSLENEQNSTPSVESKLQNIYKTFEESLSRPISPAEYSKIREWISLGYSDDMIINALKESLSKGRKSFSSIDRILLTSKARDDIENEGHTTIDETWEHNLEETIRIAKTPCIPSDNINRKEINMSHVMGIIRNRRSGILLSHLCSSSKS